MKSSLTAIFLIASLFAAANCDVLLNRNIQVGAPAGAGSTCYLTLEVFQDSASQMTMSQFWQDYGNGTTVEPNGTCIRQNFTFVPIFFQEIGNIAIQPYTGPNNNSRFANTTFTTDMLRTMNGTSCVYLPEGMSGLDQYMCNLMWGQTMVPLFFYGNGNFSFTTNNSLAPGWVQPMGASISKEQLQTRFMQNSSFPSILVNIYDSCTNQVKNLTSTANPVYIASAQNLSAYLPNDVLVWTIIKPWGSMVSGDYRVIKSGSAATLFSNLSNSTCVPMGMKVSDLVSDLNYCGLGCEVSFMMVDNATNSTIYTLQTTGLWTVGDNTPSGSTNSNGTNTNNGNPTSNSAETLVMNLSLATLILSFMYLVIFEGM